MIGQYSRVGPKANDACQRMHLQPLVVMIHYSEHCGVKWLHVRCMTPVNASAAISGVILHSRMEEVLLQALVDLCSSSPLNSPLNVYCFDRVVSESHGSEVNDKYWYNA